MATLLWGNVYYHDRYVGILREEPGARSSFIYDPSYLEDPTAVPIAHTLPLQATPHTSGVGLLPFFDNLVAEGWLEEAQTRLLGRRHASRFELLLTFGKDCAGAVWIEDPTPKKMNEWSSLTDPKAIAVLTGRASLSGVQPKFALIERDKKYYPVQPNELSTHIGKLPSKHHHDLVTNEYLTTLAFKALLPEEPCVELLIDAIVGFDEPVLIIKRFDRMQGNRIHFEEFNQLLGQPSLAKYDGSHREMADFIRETKGLTTEIYRLYLRILAGLLLGNTDMHLKNFAMFHTDQGYRLTPQYDSVSAVIYDYKTLALSLGDSKNLLIGQLKPNHIFRLGDEFGLSLSSVKMAVDTLKKNVTASKEAILTSTIGSDYLKNQIIDWIGKRWNGTFALIGQASSKKP